MERTDSIQEWTCLYTSMCKLKQLVNKQLMNMKESGEGYTGRFGGRKEREEL